MIWQMRKPSVPVGTARMNEVCSLMHHYAYDGATRMYGGICRMSTVSKPLQIHIELPPMTMGDKSRLSGLQLWWL